MQNGLPLCCCVMIQESNIYCMLIWRRTRQTKGLLHSSIVIRLTSTHPLEALSIYPPVNAFWNSIRNVLFITRLASFCSRMRSLDSLSNDSWSFLSNQNRKPISPNYVRALCDVSLVRFTYFCPSLLTHVCRSFNGMGACTYSRDMTICLPKLGKSLWWHVKSRWLPHLFDRHTIPENGQTCCWFLKQTHERKRRQGLKILVDVCLEIINRHVAF